MSYTIQSLKEKKFTLSKSDIVLSYKLLPFLEKKRILLDFMVNGILPETDSLDMFYAMMNQMLTGWENIKDDEGGQVVFDKETIPHLPVEIALEFSSDIILPSLREITDEADKQVKKGRKERTKTEQKKSLK